MTKGEAEKAVRWLVSQWRESAGYGLAAAKDVPFGEFYSWLQNEHPECLDFRTTGSVRDTVERWFDDEVRPPRHWQWTHGQ